MRTYNSTDFTGYGKDLLNELLPILPPRAQLATQQISVLQVAPEYVVQSGPEFYFLQQFFFSTCNTEICCVESWAWGGNTGNNSFNLQCNNVARQVERKCCPYNLAFTQAIFVVATQCNFCRAEVATSKSHV